MTGSVLLDSNVLIAMLLDGHVHHRAVDRWLNASSDPFATCPITEGSLVREVVRGGDSPDIAVDLLSHIGGHRRHEFWSDEIRYHEVDMSRVFGHKQVTDAYLAQLARHHGGRLATLDRGLASAHSDVAELVPTS